MHGTREREYNKRNGGRARNVQSEQSSRSVSPDISRADNLGYEDSLDVAFEHNNKLRDKIQQRMRESENLIASTFGQRSGSNTYDGYERQRLSNRGKINEEDNNDAPYLRIDDHGHLSNSNGDRNDTSDIDHVQGGQTITKASLDATGFKSKMNSALGGLLDKALSNLLHNNGKHDHK